MTDTNPHSLAGCTAVVTGATGGIGRAIALEFARAGAACLVHGRRADVASDVAEEITRLGAEAQVALVDLAEEDGPEQLAGQAWQWRGGVDIWVNNAGADVLTGDAADESFDEKLSRLWSTDVSAAVRISRLIGARMKQQQRGVILNMGWDQVEHGMAGDSGEMFSAAKGAVMAFTKSLARSLAPHVRVNCLAPGWIKTSWGDDAPEYWQQRAQSESLLGRWGTPEDVARVARFLASPAADFITGQIVAVNGGLGR